MNLTISFTVPNLLFCSFKYKMLQINILKRLALVLRPLALTHIITKKKNYVIATELHTPNITVTIAQMIYSSLAVGWKRLLIVDV